MVGLQYNTCCWNEWVMNEKIVGWKVDHRILIINGHQWNSEAKCNNHSLGSQKMLERGIHLIKEHSDLIRLRNG